MIVKHAIAVSLLLAWLSAQPIHAQQRRVQFRRGDNVSSILRPATHQGSGSMLIEPTAPITNLFSRAEDGIARRDWKFAIDSLQRIIDDPEGSLFPRLDLAESGEIVYESARRVAYRRLASLPPEGLHAYRLLYNGKASALFERGKAEHAPAILRSIVNRYLLTGHGDDAAELLASWSLDAGHPADALALLADLTELVPDTDVPPRLIALKSAAAQALLGRSEEASAIISQFAISDGRSPIPNPVSAILNLRSSVADLPSSGARTSWPVLGGSASRQGLMAPITPTLARPAPWRFDQPRYASALWRPSVTNDPDDPPAAPPGSLVAANGLVYARNPDGVIALNADDLSPIWSVGVEQAGIHASGSTVTTRSSGADRSSRAAPFDESLAQDHAAWSVSVAKGLVLTLGRRATLARTTDSRFTPPRGTQRQPGATRLSAYDAATGELRWERGRGGELADPLGQVEYRALPIAVGDALWVPVRRQRDLSVAILDPSDGSLIRSVLLGMLPSPNVSLWHALRPAADDRTIYIPSGHGVLFAVDTSDSTLRWASQYAARPCEEEMTGTSPRRRRPPSPPVVCGGLVLFTPVDRSELLAFSVTDGTVRWSVPVNESSYIIAATDAQSSNLRIWLGGRHLTCLSVPDGKTVWTQEVGAVQTGRSVLSGDTLYVPTWEGLLSFDAETGVRIGEHSVPGSHEPLGNLLCIGSALFSASPASIRRFPDVVRAYPEALARFEADPSDVRAAAELGWIELLRGNAQRAYEVVRDVDVAAEPREGRRSFGLSHVRVEALLAMADEVVDSPSESLQYLEEATRIAGTPEDRLRCGLALARKLSAVGRYAEAYRQFLRVGWERDGKRLIAVDDSVDTTARFVVSRHLRSLHPQLDDTERAALSAFAGERVARAVASLPQREGGRKAEEALRATVDMDPIGSASKTALLALADLKLAQLRYGQAEQLLLGCARRGIDASTTVLALMKLYDLYAHPWQDGANAQAAVLDRLVSGFGRAAVPDRPGETVGVWAKAARAQLSPAESASLALSGDLAWSPIFEQQSESDIQTRRRMQLGQIQSTAPALVDFGPDLPAVLARRLVLVDTDGVVRCHSSDTGDELWRAPLRFAEEFRNEIPQWTATPVDPRLRRAVAYGQIGVFYSGDALYALGLASGKRIWVRSCEEPGLSSATVTQGGDPTEAAVRRDSSMAVGPGWLVATPKAGRLTMMNLLDGETIWERDLHGETVEYVRVYGGERYETGGLRAPESPSTSEARIVTLDAKLERVHIFNPADGRLIRRVIFRQPYRNTEEWAQGERINIVEAYGAVANASMHSDTAQEQWHTGSVLCGPMSSPRGDSVLAVDLTTGETLWEMSQPKPITQLLELDGEDPSSSRYVAIALLGGDLRIVKAATGELVFEQRVPGVQKIVDAVLHKGTILVRHLAPDDSDVAITAIDVATGVEVWDRAGLAPIGTVTPPLSVIGGRIPLVLDGGLIQGRRQPLRLTMVDVRTGAEIGSTVELGVTSTNLRGHRGIDLEIRRHVVVVGTPIGIFPFATESAPIPSEGGS